MIERRFLRHCQWQVSCAVFLFFLTTLSSQGDVPLTTSNQRLEIQQSVSTPFKSLGITQFIVSDPKLLTVEQPSRDQLTLTGQLVGETELYIWDQKGMTVYIIKVLPAITIPTQAPRYQFSEPDMTKMSVTWLHNTFVTKTYNQKQRGGTWRHNEHVIGNLSEDTFIEGLLNYNHADKVKVQFNQASLSYRTPHYKMTLLDNSISLTRQASFFSATPNYRGVTLEITNPYTSEQFPEMSNSVSFFAGATRPDPNHNFLLGDPAAFRIVGSQLTHSPMPEWKFDTAIASFRPEKQTRIPLFFTQSAEWNPTLNWQLLSSYARGDQGDTANLTTHYKEEDWNLGGSYQFLTRDFQSPGTLVSLQNTHAYSLTSGLSLFDKLITWDESFRQQFKLLNPEKPTLSRSRQTEYRTTLGIVPSQTTRLGFGYNLQQNSITIKADPKSRRTTDSISHSLISNFVQTFPWEMNINISGSAAFNDNRLGADSENFTSNYNLNQTLGDLSFSLSAGLNKDSTKGTSKQRDVRKTIGPGISWDFGFGGISSQANFSRTETLAVTTRTITQTLTTNFSMTLRPGAAHAFTITNNNTTNVKNETRGVNTLADGLFGKRRTSGSIYFNYSTMLGTNIPGQTVSDMLFAILTYPFKRRGDITGIAFSDLNQNGQRDENEPPIPGLEIVLQSEFDTEKAKTAATGSYSFSGLADGIYFVGLNPELVPKETNLTTPSPAQVPISEAGSMVADFGLSPVTAELQGELFEDVNENGTFDQGDYGLEDVSLNIEGMGLHVSQVSFANGYFLIAGLKGGDYTLSVDPSTIPEGFLLISPLEQGVTVKEKESQFIPLYIKALRSLGGTVYLDTNRDGKRQASEKEVPGVRISLKGVAGTLHQTDRQGRYLFKDLKPGEITIVIDPQSIPTPYKAPKAEKLRYEIPLKPEHHPFDIPLTR